MIINKTAPLNAGTTNSARSLQFPDGCCRARDSEPGIHRAPVHSRQATRWSSAMYSYPARHDCCFLPRQPHPMVAARWRVGEPAGNTAVAWTVWAARMVEPVAHCDSRQEPVHTKHPGAARPWLPCIRRQAALALPMPAGPVAHSPRQAVAERVARSPAAACSVLAPAIVMA